MAIETVPRNDRNVNPAPCGERRRRIKTFKTAYIRRKVRGQTVKTVLAQRQPRLAQLPVRMSPTLTVKGKESGTARVFGSGTSGTCYVAILTPSNKV
jgi:hypothetical protein